jgi:hypothetical protein
MTCAEIRAAIATLNALNTELAARITRDNAAVTAAQNAVASAMQTLKTDTDQQTANKNQIAMLQAQLKMQNCP